jgi:hypothetical protein
MKKYLLINHYNWDGDWGISPTIVFGDKEEALRKMYQLVGYEICDLQINKHHVVDATDKSSEWLEEKCIEEGDDLYYVEYFGDSTILCKYGATSTTHIEWTIQEIEI